jgi:hypothetical protein
MSGHEEVPTATRLALIIARSGAAGVSRDGLRKVARISWNTLENLPVALVATGHVTLVQAGGQGRIGRRCESWLWPYLTDVLRRLPAIAPTDTAAMEALLPDRWVAAHPEHRLEQREEESREAQARRRQKRAARRAVVQ